MRQVWQEDPPGRDTDGRVRQRGMQGMRDAVLGDVAKGMVQLRQGVGLGRPSLGITQIR